MENPTKAKIENIVKTKENDIRFIRLQFTDIFGQLKSVAIPAGQISKALDNKCAFDGSCIEGFVRIEESDQYFHPDLSSFAILPWHKSRGKVARLICDVYNTDGTPFEGDPRYRLRRVTEDAASMGYGFNVGPECEFFLFNTDEKGLPTTSTQDDAGYFDLGPLDHGESTRRDICLALEEMGFEIEASHHEVAAGQHEIDFKYADAMSTADNIMTFKLAVKTYAQKNGLHATFMPKPIFGIAGSGMHVNMSLSRDGENAFCDENDELGLSETAYHFMAGLLKHARALTAICNPLINSYKRLVPGYEAPCYIAWSAKNRSPLIRVPAARGAGTRVELRSPDPSCNPYLALAVCLAAGLDGVRHRLKPPEAVNLNIYNLTAAERAALGIGSLPNSLEEAIEEMKRDEVIMDVLGDHVADRYIEAKLAECEEYRTRVSSWEIGKYFITY